MCSPRDTPSPESREWAASESWCEMLSDMPRKRQNQSSEIDRLWVSAIPGMPLLRSSHNRCAPYRTPPLRKRKIQIVPKKVCRIFARGWRPVSCCSAAPGLTAQTPATKPERHGLLIVCSFRVAPKGGAAEAVTRDAGFTIEAPRRSNRRFQCSE